MTASTGSADDQFRAFMRGNLERAAELLSVRLTGETVYGWYLRSIGSRAEHPDHGGCWLRVHSEPIASARGETWTGTADAEAITGVAKPRLLATNEWDDEFYLRRQRAELTTFVADRPVSTEELVTAGLSVPDGWWADLRRNLDCLSATVTTRQRTAQDEITRRLRVFWGDEVPSDVERWACAHGDLHWSNLSGPRLHILDWEIWGMAPLGYDPATLLCHSLLEPSIAHRVMEEFRHQLDTPDGRISQLAVAARILLRAEQGEYAALVQPLHEHVRQILHGSNPG